MSARRRLRELAKQPNLHTDQELRRIMSTTLPRARNGYLRDLRYFSEGVRGLPEFIVPEVFEALLEHLKASKVPPIETLPASFALGIDGSFKDSKVQRAFEALIGLGNAVPFQDLIQTRTEIGDLFAARWPDILSWMWYFFISCFDRDLVDRKFKMNMHRRLCLVFTVGCSRDKCTIEIGQVPGTMQLATRIYMNGVDGAHMSREDAWLGAFTISYFLNVKISAFLLDEVLAAVGGDAKVFIDTLITRLDKILRPPEIFDRVATIYLTLFLVLDPVRAVPKHPICTALRARNPTIILTDALHRALEALPQASFGSSFNSYATEKGYDLISTILSHISNVLKEDTDRIKQALQTLQTGILTVLIDCAPVAFKFKALDRDAMVDVLRQLTWLTTHLPVARQASAELERLERTCSVQSRFNASTLDVRNAWVTFYDAILARRAILLQMQTLNSTPMACDNCYRFDERATFKKCAGCGMAHYCSKDCQSRAWKEKGHRAECKGLKDKPAKGRRAMSEEKYFLARVALNDAQDKKELLKQMARIGLKQISVTVDYTLFPPRCFAWCDYEELSAHRKETMDIVDEAGRLLDRCKPALVKEQLIEITDALSSLTYEEVAVPNDPSGDAKVEESENSEPIRIQLVDENVRSDAGLAAAPPVHFEVSIPGEKGQIFPRKEHFVIDDFWDFVHIKFEDSNEDSPEVFREKDEDGKYIIAPESYSPEVQEMTQQALLRESLKVLLEKQLTGFVDQQQGELLKMIKTLGDTRNRAVDTMTALRELMARVENTH
ncbi:hypothetical protein SCHPADRAFT_945541 [Schizopora paradoxa]|uniref:MYND-type domain-containing protein n=1 Tax=Schizopora paradoxa TaxID=27342 RepID=A0A0H2R6X8_9AGAM|nr:hypothetical protein SCHPADRAFT_945541 [Schizopora paradoxa]